MPQRGYYIVLRQQRDISGVETTTILHRRVHDALRSVVVHYATVGDTPGIGIIDVARRQLITVVKLDEQGAADVHGIFIPAVQRYVQR